MLSKVYYLIRSRADGHYLVAHPDRNVQPSEPGYLLLFCEHFDALSYLNTHGSTAAAHWAVESISRAQLGGLFKRWSFTGIGIVQDPLLPEVEFLSYW